MDRYQDLYNRSINKGIYTYTDFLCEADAAAAFSCAQQGDAAVFGGFPEAERVVIRFGNEAIIPYEESFPIAVLEVIPVHEKYSEELTHRDYLGALMNLGIERDVIGDILIRENKAWIMVLEKMAEHICRELCQVKHTTVRTVRVGEVPEGALPEKQTVLLNVASARIDSVAARFCNLSRSRVSELFAAGKILINGAECHSPDRILKENDRVTVRGYGRFYYKGILKETKKKREVVMIEK